MRALLLLVCVVVVANAGTQPQPTSCMNSPLCPINTGYICDQMYVVPANSALNSAWAPWSGAGEFSAGEFYANDVSNLMDAGDGNVVSYVVAPSGGIWYVDLGMLTFNLTLISPPGVAVLTSMNFKLRQAADPCTGKPIWYPGGDFEVDFYFNTPNSYFTTAYQYVSFAQENNMLGYWPCGGVSNTVTNRLVNFTEWSELPTAPLFGVGAQGYGPSVPNANSNYDGVVIMWGSSGFNYATNSYYTGSVAGPHMGMDIAFGVKCTNNVNPPPNGTPACLGCAHAGASPSCTYARADTNDNTCVSLSFDGSNCIFDNLM